MARELPDYDEVVIRLTPGREDAYNVEIASAAGARSHGLFVAPSQLDIERFRRTMDPGRRVRGRSPYLEAATRFGAELFQALLSSASVREVYAVARRDASAAKRGLRVTLSLRAVPELASIPWEFLYDRPRFLAQHVDSPVVRFVDLEDPPPPLRVEGPLRVLGMVSRLKDDVLAELDAEKEQRALERRLRPLIDRGQVTLDWLARATLPALQQEVDHGEDFHVFHYIGHGEYDEESGHSSLILEHDDGRPRRVEGQRLGTLLCDRGSLRLAVLNTCEAAQTAPQDPLAGVATSLMEYSVPAVVAMQFAITDGGALTFADEFYGALAGGYDVDAAVTQARRALAADSDVEWGTPVLFMRVADGRLFDLQRTTPPVTSGTAEAPADPRDQGPPAAPPVIGARRLARPGRPSRRAAWSIAIGLGFAAVAATAVILIPGPGDQPLRIYSSQPERERQQPASVARSGADRSSRVVPNQRTIDMEDAMRLALKQAGGRAGDFDVTYEPLDGSDAGGASPRAVVQANAKRAASDDTTAVYIGDFTSDSTQESIPILSRARVPQISVSSTRVGLTIDDERGDVDEPTRYYPQQPGYHKGYRNFLRIIPRTSVHAKALLALMAQTDQCKKVAMIDDDSAYGEALANDILAYNHRRVTFVFSQSIGPFGKYEHLIDRARRSLPDCFVYSGIRNPNTVEIFEAFARTLPQATLYGTNGVVAASFYDHDKGGISRAVADRVQIMVPPYDSDQSAAFIAAFTQAYSRDPGPYAIYAYEAMQLALDAIAESATGRREDIRNALFRTQDRQNSMLGSYSIRSTGDTSIASYGVSRVKDGKLTPPRTAPRLLPR